MAKIFIFTSYMTKIKQFFNIKKKLTKIKINLCL